MSSERIEPPFDSPRHDHYGRPDNCSIDCPAHPDRGRAIELPSDDPDDRPCTCEGFDFSPTCPRHADLAP